MSAASHTPSVTAPISCQQPPVQEDITSTTTALTALDAPSTNRANGFSMLSYLVDSQVARAEILYCLKMIKNHASMRSADDLHELFRAMFPDSKVAEKFSMARTKTTYTINYGLAQFFATELKDKVHSTESFVVCFDESLNSRSARADGSGRTIF